jgi:hypothetical protein
MGKWRNDAWRNGGVFERHGRQPMRAGPCGRIRARAGLHSRANPLLIARLCIINSPMSVSARPFRANTFFAQPWAENGHSAERREPIMARSRRARSVLSPRQIVNAPRRGGALVWLCFRRS